MMKRKTMIKKILSIVLIFLICLTHASCLERTTQETETQEFLDETVVFDDTDDGSETSEIEDNTEESSEKETETVSETVESQTEPQTMSESATETESQKETVAETIAESETEAVIETETQTATQAVNEDTLYQNIECVIQSQYKKQQFYFLNDGFAVNITVPSDWTFSQESTNVFSAIRGGKKIGTVTRNDGASGEWVCVKQSVSDKTNVKTVAYIEKNGTGESLSFRYRMTFAELADPDNILFSLCIDYAEISVRTRNHLYRASIMVNVRSDPQIGVARSSRAQESILIIGNSFVNSSSIGTTLRQMCEANSKNTEITAISRGYAHVSTYTQDVNFMNGVRSGQYGIIFVCGFYSNEESTSLFELKEACNSAGTQLVIFPAHNEPRSCIDLAVSEHGDLLILDWKQEIEFLIKYGVDKWDMCINDAHLHSTALAGFVGAHMIYRAVFGEIPKRSDFTAIPTSTVLEKLGNYCSTGVISYIDDGAVQFK